MKDILPQLENKFRELFGEGPSILVRAPGSVRNDECRFLSNRGYRHSGRHRLEAGGEAYVAQKPD